MDVALDQVKERVASIRNLPGEADEPVIKRIINYEPVARLLVTGRDGQNLRPIVREIERELIQLGIAKVDIFGLPARGDRHPGAFRRVARARHVALRRRPAGRGHERGPPGRQHRPRRDREAVAHARSEARRGRLRAPGAALRRRRALPRTRRRRDGGTPRPQGRDPHHLRGPALGQPAAQPCRRSRTVSNPPAFSTSGSRDGAASGRPGWRSTPTTSRGS